MTSKRYKLLGKWRIISMELWDAAFIDLLGPGYIRFDADGGDFAFGAVQGEIDGHSGSDSIHFPWEGSDKIDHASGDGQLEDNGTLTGKIRFHHGDESAFTAQRW